MNFGIVAEFNPFHNGHKLLVDYAHSLGGTVTAVMSENFVQRGECACMHIQDRVRCALNEGVDLVVSLPLPFATASAERFAKGGIQVLGSLGFVEGIAFGCECDNTSLLCKCADALMSEEYNRLVEEFLGKGVSYPSAGQGALTELAGEEMGNLVSTPNNILGIEYIKAIKKYGYPIEPYPLKRQGAEHDSLEATGNICSATYIRDILNKGEGIEDISLYMPESSAQVLAEATEQHRAPVDYRKLELPLLYKLRGMSPEDFTKLPDVSEGLEYRLYEAVRSSSSVEEILTKTKTKRYTHSRLRRILLSALLEITAEDVNGDVPYIRVLGFNSTGAGLLKEAKEKASLPIVSRVSHIKELDEYARHIFELESRAGDVFALAMPEIGMCGLTQQNKLIVL